MKQIISSLLTNDLYKFTMQQLVRNQYPNVEVEYAFINRGQTPFPKGFDKILQSQVNAMGDINIDNLELVYLQRSAPFLQDDYIQWLKGFSPDPSSVNIKQIKTNLEIKIKGPWYQAIYWEVPLMAVISELFFLETGKMPTTQWAQNAYQKGATLKINGISFADFGLRRRYSSKIHEDVVRELKCSSMEIGKKGGFVGTSDVEIAFKQGLRPIGTMAHELPMVLAAVHGYESANNRLLLAWTKEYGGDLGIVLTDTFTTKVFLRTFNQKYANLFDGVRQDFGSPEQFADTMIAHYKMLGIDPLTKTIIFSDGLNPNRVIELANYCDGRINCSFGIGTNLSNDVGVTPLNIVIKVARAKFNGSAWAPTIKLSDTNGKVTGDKKTVLKAKALLGI